MLPRGKTSKHANVVVLFILRTKSGCFSIRGCNWIFRQISREKKTGVKRLQRQFEADGLDSRKAAELRVVV